MRIRNFLLSAAVAVMTLASILTDVKAASLFSPLTSVPLSCVISSGTANVTINTAPPVPVTCPTDSSCPGLTGNFLRWDYSFGYTGISSTNPAYSLLSFATDVEIVAANPPAPAVSTPGAGETAASTYVGRNVFETAFLTFTTTGANSLSASYFTKTGLVPRVATAGFQEIGRASCRERV